MMKTSEAVQIREEAHALVERLRIGKLIHASERFIVNGFEASTGEIREVSHPDARAAADMIEALLAHTARPDAGDSNRKALIEIANMIPGCFATEGVTDELLGLIPAEVRAWTEKLSARPDAGEEVERADVPGGLTINDPEFYPVNMVIGSNVYVTQNGSQLTFCKSTLAMIARAALAAICEGVDRGTVERTEVQAVWRCAIGDMVGAMDILKKHWVLSKRRAERQAGEVLSRVLDLVWEYRDPAPSSYEEANDNGKALADRVCAALMPKNG